MSSWSTGYKRCPHHHNRQDDHRVTTTFGISLLGPIFVYFANTNRYSANTCSFETFYGSEYFILKCGRGSLFVRETTPSSSDQTENRCYLKACSACSPLRPAGQLFRTRVEWFIINTLGLWDSEETNPLVFYCHFPELIGHHSVLLGLFCGHGSIDTPPSSSGCYMPERMRQKFLSCDKKSVSNKTWKKKDKTAGKPTS